MRAGPGATVGAARGTAQAGARYPGIGPTSGHGRPLRDGGALGLPGLVARPRRDPYAGGSKVCGDFEHPTFLAAHVYTQMEKLVQVEA